MRGAGTGISWARRTILFPSRYDPFIKRLEQARRDAQVEIEKVEERWKKKADEALFFGRLDELQSYKRDYESLEEVRAAKLKQLEPSSSRARIEVDREIDDWRRLLENKLARGAIFLDYTRLEIEECRQKLLPALIKARRSLAQAETDLEVASNWLWFKMAVLVLVVVFAAGTVAKYVVELLLRSFA